MRMLGDEKSSTEDLPRVTPFLFIPQDSKDLGSTRPLPAGVGWVDSPSIFLLSEDGKLELSPRYGIRYRFVVLVGNSGTVPAENCFAEFHLGASMVDIRPPDDPKVNEEVYLSRSPFQPSEYSTSLGVSSFSVAQSRAGHELSWAISPNTWQADSLLHDCVYVRVFDLIHDVPSPVYQSWLDRKVASKVLTCNLAGVWAGDEIDTATGQTLGKYKFELTQDWSINDIGYGASLSTCTIDLKEMPHVTDRINPNDFPIRASISQGTINISCSYDTPAVDVVKLWSAYFGTSSEGGTRYWSYNTSDHSEHIFSIAVLSRDNSESSSPKPDTTILHRVRQVIPTYWPPSRKADAKCLFHAINSL